MAKKKTAALSKRKTTTPKKAPKQQRKVTRRKRKTTHPTYDVSEILDFDQVYKVINKIQMMREVCVFSVSEKDAAVIKNIMKDLNLSFQETAKNNIHIFKVSPAPEQPISEMFDNLEEFPDEIVEDGQIF